MSEVKSNLKGWQITGLLFIVALTVKLIYIKLYGAPYVLSPDGRLYSDIAENILQGQGFVNTHSYMYSPDGTVVPDPTGRDYVVGPVYPLLLAGIYSLFGLHAYGAVVVLHAVMNACSVILAYKIGTKLWGRRAALIPYALMLFYPGFSLWGQFVLTESTYVLAFLLFLYVMVCYQGMMERDKAAEQVDRGVKQGRSSQKSLLLPCLLGAVIGISNLVRPFLLLALPLIFVWIWWLKDWKIRQTVQDFLVLTLVAAAVMSPWWVRNYLKYDRFIAATNYGAYELYAGNNPYTITDQAFYKSSLSYDPAVKAAVEKLPLMEQEKEYSRLAKDYILAHPLGFVQRTWEKGINIFWKPVTSSEGKALHMIGYSLDRWYIWLGCLGALVALTRLKKYAFLLFFILYYSAAVSAITVVDGGRYRLPIMPAVILLAALALIAGVKAWREKIAPYIQERIGKNIGES